MYSTKQRETENFKEETTMTRTNYGNGYKFKAIMERRRKHKDKDEVMVQRMKKDGTCGKPLPSQRYGKETDEDVVARLIEYNHRQFRLAKED